MKETFYFPHDYNASQDAKILELIDKFGLVGVGAYWTIIEILHQQPDGKISFNVFKGILKKQMDMFEEPGVVNNLCSTFVELGLFDNNDNVITSKRVLNNKKHRKSVSLQRSIAGQISANKRLGTNVQRDNGRVFNYIKERKGKERKYKEVKKQFTPPTLNELTTYCKTNSISINHSRFVDFYESKGWMVGKNKMKDWKAAVRNWSRSEPTSQSQVRKDPQPNKDCGTCKGSGKLKQDGRIAQCYCVA